MNYKEYIQSDEWKTTRNRIIREEGICRRHKDNTGIRIPATCVHHLKYFFDDLGNWSGRFAPLCQQCHDFLHTDFENRSRKEYDPAPPLHPYIDPMDVYDSGYVMKNELCSDYCNYGSCVGDGIAGETMCIGYACEIAGFPRYKYTVEDYEKKYAVWLECNSRYINKLRYKEGRSWKIYLNGELMAQSR